LIILDFRFSILEVLNFLDCIFEKNIAPGFIKEARIENPKSKIENFFKKNNT